ncbi:50S ribosomal protein L11 methyltransferase [Solirubrobacter sp. CPCC 204708]|uniref:50S ribosomal protein L11 methyltransferase n=1 Tax=Solirubrobacter deserti TaxID=2282478 RepID=A0ABT4RSJ8_9ACTN|nr:50S ribosomal protein L11 methyltransferase [Solirubrobacter deserti]MBE2316361.1 50S ribosomal protein L11 methyltransferase [Solirubrobacter deserti]MDA0141559.1 50S ribosomal protein L11 methyltransferase [Solirubrobacter deserti]
MNEVCDASPPMYRLTFRGDEDLLDAVLPLLPGGVREDEDALVAYSGAPFSDAVLALTGGAVDEVPADWKQRKMSAGVVIGGVVGIRSPFDRESGAPIEVVVERRGSAFGSGSHPTTQMCVALLLELEPGGSVADLGCGVGTLAIVAAKLGWAPVVGVDRVPVAIEVARENVERNGVDVDVAVSDLAVDDIPLANVLLVNAPPPVHERVAAAVDDRVRHVIVSGIVAEEMEDVVRRYTGFKIAKALGTEDEWIALRLSC